MPAPATTPAGERCPWCGRPLRLVSVHGHEQCAWCGAPVLPCCEGTPLGPGDVCPIPETPVPSPPSKTGGSATVEPPRFPSRGGARTTRRRKRRSSA